MECICVCQECGSQNVRVRRWFRPITGEEIVPDDVLNDGYGKDDGWCEDCKDNCYLLLIDNIEAFLELKRESLEYLEEKHRKNTSK